MIDESKLFFEETFADITLSKELGDKLLLRLGRQEFELGDGRLVDVREGPNVRQAFDGASLNWKGSSWNIHGFALKPVLNGTGVLDAPPDHSSTFWGVYAVHPMPKIRGGNIDLYYLGFARKDAVFELGSEPSPLSVRRLCSFLRGIILDESIAAKQRHGLRRCLDDV